MFLLGSFFVNEFIDTYYICKFKSYLFKNPKNVSILNSKGDDIENRNNQALNTVCIFRYKW